MFPTQNPIRLVCWSTNQSKFKRGMVRAVDGELCCMLMAMPVVCGRSSPSLVVGVKCLVSDSSSRKQWAQRSPRTTSSQPSRTCSRTVRLRSDPLPPKRSRVSVRMLSASHKAYVEIMVWMRSFYRLIYHGIYNPHFCPQSFARTFQKTAERPSSWLTFCPVSR